MWTVPDKRYRPFFKLKGCGNISDEGTTMPDSRNRTIATINTRQIQKIMLAAATGLDSSRISDYLRHRSLSAERVQKIEAAVDKIIYVWDTFKPYRIILDGPELLDQAYSEAQDERTTRRLRNVSSQLEQAVREADAGLNTVLGASRPDSERVAQSD